MTKARELVIEAFETLLQEGYRASRTAGGSASNALKVISQLGVTDVTLCTMIEKDEEGNLVTERLNQLGVKVLNVNLHETSEKSHSAEYQEHGNDLEDSRTGIVNCFITCDPIKKVVERTMQSYLGIANFFEADMIRSNYFDGKKCVVLDGYQIYHKGMLEKCIEDAKQRQALVVMGLPSPVPLHEFKETFLAIAEKIDFLFGNRKEFAELTGCKDPEEALKSFDHDKFRQKTLVATDGKKGCWVKSANTDEVRHFNAIEVDDRLVVDTTGAGDFFLGGFVKGYLDGSSVDECVRLGNLAASFVIQQIGADLPAEKWVELKKCADEGLQDKPHPISLTKTVEAGLLN